MTAVNLQDDVALSSLARGLVGSEILKIAGEIRKSFAFPISSTI